MVFGEPEVEAIEEVETRPIDQPGTGWLLFGAEEDGRGKDALEALDDAAVIAAVLGKPEELQHLGGAFETYGAALLPEREGGNPDRDEAILAEGQAEVGMTYDVEEEISVAALVAELIFRQRPERDAAQYKGSGIEGGFLLPVLALFPN